MLKSVPAYVWRWLSLLCSKLCQFNVHNPSHGILCTVSASGRASGCIFVYTWHCICWTCTFTESLVVVVFDVHLPIVKHPLVVQGFGLCPAYIVVNLYRQVCWHDICTSNLMGDLRICGLCIPGNQSTDYVINSILLLLYIHRVAEEHFIHLQNLVMLMWFMHWLQLKQVSTNRLRYYNSEYIQVKIVAMLSSNIEMAFNHSRVALSLTRDSMINIPQ